MSTYTGCLTSSALSSIPADLKNSLKKIGSDMKNVVPKFTQNLSIKTHEMGVKQYFYRGIDFSHHVHAMAGAFLNGDKLMSGDNFFSYGVAFGNFIGFPKPQNPKTPQC